MVSTEKKTGEKIPDRFHAEGGPSFRISGNLVYSVIEDHQGLIWIGTTQGLDLFDPTSHEMSHFRKSAAPGKGPADDFITSLCEDHSGDIWIGTSAYLNRFSRRENTFTFYGMEQGIPGNLIYSMVMDHRQRMWIATGNGLCRYDQATGSFRTYTVNEGLQSAEFNLGAAFLAGDGELLLGGMNGFNAFYPDSLADNPHIPSLAFTGIWKTAMASAPTCAPPDTIGSPSATMTTLSPWNSLHWNSPNPPETYTNTGFQEPAIIGSTSATGTSWLSPTSPRAITPSR